MKKNNRVERKNRPLFCINCKAIPKPYTQFQNCSKKVFSYYFYIFFPPSLLVLEPETFSFLHLLCLIFLFVFFYLEYCCSISFLYHFCVFLQSAKQFLPKLFLLVRHMTSRLMSFTKCHQQIMTLSLFVNVMSSDRPKELLVRLSVSAWAKVLANITIRLFSSVQMKIYIVLIKFY